MQVWRKCLKMVKVGLIWLWDFWLMFAGVIRLERVMILLGMGGCVCK